MTREKRKDSIDLSFGALLGNLRKRQDLTQEDVAKIVSLDSSTIAKVEQGHKHPPQNSLFYERLREIPGFNETDINALLSSRLANVQGLTEMERGILRRSLGESHEEKPSAEEASEAGLYRSNFSVAGIRVSLLLNGESSFFSKKEIRTLGRIVQDAAETTINGFLQTKAEQMKHWLSRYFPNTN